MLNVFDRIGLELITTSQRREAGECLEEFVFFFIIARLVQGDKAPKVSGQTEGFLTTGAVGLKESLYGTAQHQRTNAGRLFRCKLRLCCCQFPPLFR